MVINDVHDTENTAVHEQLLDERVENGFAEQNAGKMFTNAPMSCTSIITGILDL